MAVNHKLALERFEQADAADTNQRIREKEDLGFYEGEGQWPSEIKNLRKGQAASGNMPAVPARPCITVNKIKDPVRHVINEFVQADLGVTVVPADDMGAEPIDDNELELREGMIRRIQREPEAQESQVWAVSRADICGRGFFGIMTRDVPGPTFDQEIYYRRFYDQFSVLLDPAHEQPDGSDIEWAFVGENVPWHVYKVEYERNADGKKNPVLNADDAQWRAYGDDAPKWFTTDGETRTVRVVEYWYYEREVVDYVLLNDGSIVDADTLDAATLKAIPKDRRKRDIVKTVKFARLDGAQTLTETDWPGPHIPIVKIIGEEMHPFDGERREEGMVRSARGPQQGFNYMITAATELVGLAPKDPPVGAAGQFEGFEDQWDNAAVRTIARLEYNPIVTATGSQVLPPPSRQGHEPPIQAMAMMMREYDAAIKSTTGIPDPTLGNVDPNARSGKAIRAMLEQALRGTSNYMANAIRSMHRAGDIVNGLLEPVYARKGRIARIMTTTNETRSVMLHQPFVSGANGRPEAFDQAKHAGQTPTTYALTKNGRTNTAIKVQKHYDTKRQEEAVHLSEIIEAQPEFMTWFGDLFFKAQDSPGSKELGERAKVMLAPPIQKLLAGNGPQDPRLQQAESQIEQLTAELQKQLADKGAKIESAQIKANSDAQQTQSDNQTKYLIARMQEMMESQRAAADRETKLAVAEFQAMAKELQDTRALFAAEVARLGVQAHEANEADKTRGHDAATLAAEHDHELDVADQAHGHALAQGAQDAALAPTPGSNNGN